jgi:undecaprenol kinase
VKQRPFRERLGFAVAGLVQAWRREASLRIQVGLGGAAVALTALLRPGPLWTAVILIAVALVISLELVNAAIEAVIDHLHPEQAPEIRRAKDMAAGAVLIAAAGAAAAGVLMVLSVAFGW